MRVIAATNRDLEAEVRAGRFRQDLYFRLKVVTIPVPPLRDHAEDIPALAEYFLTQLRARVPQAGAADAGGREEAAGPTPGRATSGSCGRCWRTRW